MHIEGRWRIVEMDLWDQEATDLLGPAFMEIGRGNEGSFRFIAVEGCMDVRRFERDGAPTIEFSWAGSDDCDPATGRGWATLEDDRSMSGRIYIHDGDDSAFRAVQESGCPDC